MLFEGRRSSPASSRPARRRENGIAPPNQLVRQVDLSPTQASRMQTHLLQHHAEDQMMRQLSAGADGHGTADQLWLGQKKRCASKRIYLSRHCCCCYWVRSASKTCCICPKLSRTTWYEFVGSNCFLLYNCAGVFFATPRIFADKDRPEAVPVLPVIAV